MLYTLLLYTATSSMLCVVFRPCPHLLPHKGNVHPNSAQYEQSCVCVHLYVWHTGGASGCNGILPSGPSLSFSAVYPASRLTLRWLRRRLNAHLTHSLPLWCNPVEVISFTGLSTSASVGVEGGAGGVESVFNQPATSPSP